MINILDDVIFTELKKKEAQCQEYEAKLKTLPKGTLFFQRSGDAIYAYLKWKKDNKTLSKYLGKVGESKTKQNINQVNEYKKIYKEYKQAKSELKELKKAYRLLILKTKIN